MIRQNSVHSLKKLFDAGLAGPAAVVFGRRGLGAAGRQKPPAATAQELFGWQDKTWPPPDIRTYSRTEVGVRKDARSSR